MVLMAEPRRRQLDPNPIVVMTQGVVSETQIARARRGIDRVLQRHHIAAPARVRLTAPRGSGAPMLVQANLRLPGGPVRVQVTGPIGFAVTFAIERLDLQLDKVAAGGTWPNQCRPALTRVTGAHPIVRRKESRLHNITAAKATAILEAMDYDAHLYVDAELKTDAIVYRAGENALQDTAAPPSIPCLDESAAAARLCALGLPVLYFTDPACGRGRLLYRRYDGDLAIVLAR
ncbi:hypothetical protein [Nocardia sp. NPDC051832]|uniref:sigma 54 modulation/S30EA ribosomal C-terminal domain-containing protein n=1 Tax=Nocardia sp. NPDC051832 TaxID=3155673 RepID=UPI0034341418